KSRARGAAHEKLRIARTKTDLRFLHTLPKVNHGLWPREEEEEAMSSAKMHKCPDCGQSVQLRRDEVPFGLVGKWAATVEAQVYDCACGRGVVYEAVEPMVQAIAAAVIKKPSRLAPEEIRFLREHLRMSAKDFGRLVGVTPSQVSRWENGAPMGATA